MSNMDISETVAPKMGGLEKYTSAEHAELGMDMSQYLPCVNGEKL